MIIVEFILTALLWGGGALMTAFQVGSVPAPVSVGYRMTLVGLLMLGAGGLAGIRLRLAREDAVWVALQGVLFFGLAFIALYSATRSIPSGLAALILSMSSVFAALIARVFLGTSLSLRAAAGLLCGILGLAIVFGPDLPQLLGDSRVIVGAAWALLSAIATAAGTVIAARNQRHQVPMVAVMGWGACVGAAVAFAWSIAAGLPFRFDPSLRYVGSLGYLALFASGAAFVMYFDLVRRIGPSAHLLHADGGAGDCLGPLRALRGPRPGAAHRDRCRRHHRWQRPRALPRDSRRPLGRTRLDPAGHAVPGSATFRGRSELS